MWDRKSALNIAIHFKTYGSRPGYVDEDHGFIFAFLKEQFWTQSRNLSIQIISQTKLVNAEKEPFLLLLLCVCDLVTFLVETSQIAINGAYHTVVTAHWSLKYYLVQFQGILKKEKIFIVWIKYLGLKVELEAHCAHMADGGEVKDYLLTCNPQLWWWSFVTLLSY